VFEEFVIKLMNLNCGYVEQHNKNLCPNCLQHVHALDPGNYDFHTQFCLWMLIHHQVLHHTLFSHEVPFNQGGINNT
jgi:hypothetical protein